MATKMTLKAFADSIKYPVLYLVTEVMQQSGEYAAMNCDDQSYPENWDNIEGEVNDGEWRWDGWGKLYDSDGSPVYFVQASSDPARWHKLTGE